jgi:ectoine hydroxylase-related dioxygenase (phytanoyl-CoA dioxygenase family)
MGRHPDPVKDANIKTVAAEGSAGTPIITDGRIWHGTGSNRTDENRVAMLLTFCGPQYRPQVNYTIALDPEVLEQATDRQKTMFGLKVWWGYGRTGHPSVEFINPSDKGLGQLNPS